MSRLLEEATEEVKSGNRDITQKVRHIGNKFLNAVEISTQEAAHLVLQIPMRRSTRDFQFMNTSHPDERTFLLKKLDKIKELPDNSCEIESDNIIQRYQRRPKQLENICLADFVAWFNCVKDNESDTVYGDKFDIGSDDFMPEAFYDVNTIDDDPYNMDEQQSEQQELKMKGGMCNDIDVIVLFTSGPHLRHNYHGNKTLETMLSGSVEFVGHRLNRPVLLHLCVCRVLPINNATV